MVVLEEVREQGWSLARGMDPEAALAAVQGLGRVLLETRVVERRKSDGVATVPLHTDHWRADLVAWYCHASAENGCELLLADARKALDLLDAADHLQLARVLVTCDGVLAQDARRVPLVRRRPDGALAVYYAQGLVAAEHRQSPALQRFKVALAKLAPVGVRLSRGDLLVVDNGRMLHGRGALGTGAVRELTRWWIALAGA